MRPRRSRRVLILTALGSHRWARTEASLPLCPTSQKVPTGPPAAAALVDMVGPLLLKSCGENKMSSRVPA